ncbi:MAG: hypothetical protein F6J93_26585 [Oscillatoria sp. SIO1A7]|nr:hypothetical protein [Oscillatoria sp. SIO1A7]
MECFALFCLKESTTGIVREIVKNLPRGKPNPLRGGCPMPNAQCPIPISAY